MRVKIIILLALFSLKGFSQQETSTFKGLLFNINHSLKISNRNYVKSSFEYRIAEKATENDRVKNEHRQDLTIGIQRNLNELFKVAVGGMYRNANFGDKSRLYQQVGFLQQTLTRVSFVHRLRVDETFSKKEPEFRFRYRLGLQMPLRGYKTDPGETYIAFVNEFLRKFKGNNSISELRIATQLGFQLKNKKKFEVEFEIRSENPINSPENLYLLGFGYYFSN